MGDATEGAQRGAAAILGAALLIGLMGIAVIALDGSNAHRARSDTQRAADAAALAAAWEDCTGTGDPVGVGLAAAATNGYPAGVSVSHVGDDWVVTVDETIEAPFGRAIGRDTVSVQTRAVARCDLKPADQYALFTGGTHCNNSLSLTGSSSEVTGNVHSNSDIQISGSSNTINGNGSALGTAPGPPQVQWAPSEGNPEAVAVPLDYPMMYAAASFAPGGAKAIEAGSDHHHFGSDDIDIAALTDAGLWDAATATVATGLYYTTGSISLSASSMTGTVTFVTDPPLVSELQPGSVGHLPCPDDGRGERHPPGRPDHPGDLPDGGRDVHRDFGGHDSGVLADADLRPVLSFDGGLCRTDALAVTMTRASLRLSLRPRDVTAQFGRSSERRSSRQSSRLTSGSMAERRTISWR